MAPALSLLAALALSALDASAQPPFAVAGGAGATVELTADGPVELSTNVGTLSAPEPAGPGKWRARFTPPPQRFPQVALIFILQPATGARRWLALPIHGSDTLKLTTKPSAQVELTIGEARFTGTADRLGKLQVPVVVAPGIRSASVRSVDRLGNARVKTLDLDPPPFQRVRLVPLSKDAASWADARPLPLELFAVEPTGAPAKAEPLLSADEGQARLEAPLAPGVWAASYTAPEKVGDGKALVRAELKDAPGSRGEAELPVRGGPPASLKVVATPPRYVAGSAAPIEVELSALDAKGNVVEVPGDFSADLGTVTRSADGKRASLKLPDFFEGKSHVTLSAGAASAQVALVPGQPANGQIAFPNRTVRAGDAPQRGEVLLHDSYGNPVTGETLAVEAQQGKVAATGERAPGRYELLYDAGEPSLEGVDQVNVRPAGSPLTLSSQLTLLRYRPSWGISAGVFGSGVSNASALVGGGGSAEVALTVARLPLELLALVGYNLYGPLRVERPSDNVYNEGAPRALLAGGGLRYSLPLSPRVALHASAAGGWMNASLKMAVRESGTDKLVWEGEEAQARLWVRGAAGVALALGPGRVMAQLELCYARGPATGLLDGNLGGGSLAVGYLLYLR